MQMKVMTFNLRIDVPVDGPNQWRHRVSSVMAMIDQHQPDILLLQETTQAMLTDLQALNHEYDGYYQGRNADLTGEGCPIYFKKNLFRLRFMDTIWLSQKPRTPGSMDEEEGFPRIASMVVLQHTNGLLYRFINCHLAYRSKRAKDTNLKVLFDFALSLPEPLPTIIGGDFNDTMPKIKTYTPRPFLFALAQDQTNTYHEFLGGAGISQIDHLLYNDGFKLESVVIDQQKMLNRYPSDHYPVVGVFHHES
jgi:endonuclease/exonuclease/phosphatase family metal-dependent hydrolase